jgi:hypothetical protein
MIQVGRKSSIYLWNSRAGSTAESVPTIQPSAFGVPKIASALPPTSSGAVIPTRRTLEG